MTILCQGNINSNGNVSIPIQKLKNVLDEGISGTLKLEVIADGESYFVPWSDEFETKLSKKVTVEVTSKNHNKPLIENNTPQKSSTKITFKKTELSLSKKELLECITEYGKLINKISRKLTEQMNTGRTQ